MIVLSAAGMRQPSYNTEISDQYIFVGTFTMFNIMSKKISCSRILIKKSKIIYTFVFVCFCVQIT